MKHLISLIAFLAAAAAYAVPAAPPLIDLSKETQLHTVIAEGTPTYYHGHPTMTQLADGKTLLAVWSAGHGGALQHMAASPDGGITWERCDERIAADGPSLINCPSIYRLTNPVDGIERLWIFAQRNPASAWMPRLLSLDGGLSWSAQPPLGEEFGCVMSFSSIVPISGGRYLGMFHSGPDGADAPPLKVYQSITADGGLTWSPPTLAAAYTGRNPCEPYVFRQPGGSQLCCIMRENARAAGKSLMMTSDDEAQTWTTPADTSFMLSGDRHQGITLPDGRLMLVFRNMAGTEETGHFYAWIGTYQELTSGKEQGYRVKLLHNYSVWDCGYPGIALAPDGDTVTALTYIKYFPDNRQSSIVAIRLSIRDLDRRAAEARKAIEKM